MANEHVSEELTTGLKTTRDELLPLGVRVTWIGWNSGFRGSDLQIGDRIIAVDGEPLDPAHDDIRYSHHVGALGEHNRWKKRGASDGQTVSLTVQRPDELLQIRGPIAGQRSWRGADNRPLLAPEGPDKLSNDGFVGGWGSWYDKLVETLSVTLDGRWRHRMDNRGLLAALLTEKPRVDLLVARWPGPFADLLAADFAAATRCLEGRPHPLTPADVAYRELGTAKKAEVASMGKAARAAFLEAHAAEVIPAFPAARAMDVDARMKVAGKIVVLPVMARGSSIKEGHRFWLVAGDDRQGYYLIDTATPVMERMYDAEWRYRGLFDPRPREGRGFIGRIGADPRMVVRDGRAITGLSLEPLAVSCCDDALFVDLEAAGGDTSRFAGEPSSPPKLDLADDASPGQVVESFFAALFRGDQAAWLQHFATWDAKKYDSGHVAYYAQSPPHPPAQEREWVRARGVIMDRVHAVRVHRVDPVRVLLDGSEFLNAPVIEEVVVEIDHVGLIDGTYRVFSYFHTHRLLTLQRRSGGCWRITTQEGI